MHKIIITAPEGVVISTKHHAVGTILPNVPPGIAKAIIHFKQGKDLNAPETRTTGDVGGGSPVEDFTSKLKLLLVDDYDLKEAEAADLLKANTHLVGLGAIGGNAALEQTAYALVQAGYEPGAGRTTVLPHPASRIPMVGGATPTPGGTTFVSNQPTAPFTQPVAVGGGTIAAPVPGAAVDGGADRPSALQEATTAAETAEVKAAASDKVTGAKAKPRK